MIIRSINSDVFPYYRTERFANLLIGLLATAVSQNTIGEIGVHATSVPIEVAQRFAMPVNRYTILLSYSFKKVTGNPNLVASLLSTFGKNLKLPLSCRHFSVNAFHI